MASPKKVEIELLTTQEVAEASGVSYRMMDYYVRQGYFQPVVQAQGSGSRRLWDPAVLDEIAELQRKVSECPFCSRDSNRGNRG